MVKCRLLSDQKNKNHSTLLYMWLDFPPNFTSHRALLYCSVISQICTAKSAKKVLTVCGRNVPCHLEIYYYSVLYTIVPWDSPTPAPPSTLFCSGWWQYRNKQHSVAEPKLFGFCSGSSFVPHVGSCSNSSSSHLLPPKTIL